MEVGDKVIHSYGKGKILKLTENNLGDEIARVKFEAAYPEGGYMYAWIDTHNLELVEEDNNLGIEINFETNLDEVESQLDRIIDKLEKVEELQEKIGNKPVLNFEGNVYGMEDLEEKVRQAIVDADREIYR